MSSQIENKMFPNMSIGILSDNLRFLMDKVGIDSGELAQKTGIALTTLNGLKRGVGNPTLTTLCAVAEYFNITIGQLTESDLSKNTGCKKVVCEIPLLDLNKVAEFVKDSCRFEATLFLELEDYKQGSHCAIKITNNSMAPLFEKGTIFLINRNLTIQDGDLVLVQFGEHLPCFRKIFIEEKNCFFNPVSEIFGKNLIKSESFVIYGVVIKAIQNFYD